jgi:hypothetical protein
MKSYENLREKLERQCEWGDREIDRLNARCVDLENQNFALSKGISTHQLIKTSESPCLEHALQQKCVGLEQDNEKLEVALKQMQGEFKDLLREVERLRGALRERD